MDKADISWLLVSTLLVLMMAVPGLAMFYGGLVRSKNVLSVLLQVLCTFVLGLVLWFIYGYSLAFTEGNAFFGGLSRAFFSGMFTPADGKYAMSNSLTELLFASFQATFAGITCALVVGSFAERARFSAVLVFTVIWFTFAYVPIAHMVWFASETAPGLLNARGALDFAGGTVVHINAGVAGLVGAYVIGKRVGYGREAMQPHNLPMTFVARRAAVGGLVRLQRRLGPGRQRKRHAGLLQHHDRDRRRRAGLADHRMEHQGKPSMLGAASGAVAGLVGITPAAGLVGPAGAGHRRDRRRRLRLGREWPEAHPARRRLAGRVRRARRGRHRRRAADRRVQCPGPGGPGLAEPGMIAHQLWVQLEGVLLTIVWSGVVALIAYKIANALCGLRAGRPGARRAGRHQPRRIGVPQLIRPARRAPGVA